MVTLTVVALRMSVPAIIGTSPSNANATIVHMPPLTARLPGVRPARSGSS